MSRTPAPAASTPASASASSPRRRSSPVQPASQAAQAPEKRPRYDPETNRSIYVGDLPKTMDKHRIQEIFATVGSIHAVVFYPDGTLSSASPYAFVDYDDPKSAQTAIETLNNCTIEGCSIRVKPAYRSLRNVSTRDVNAHHYDIHISELDPEVKDADLYEIFKEYKSLSDVRVIWDMETGKSRQFAFVSFRERGDAHRALREKSGVILKKRRILISYGNLKFYSKSLPLSAEAAPKSNLLFDVKQDALKNLNDNEKYSVVVLQTPISCCTVYFGNIAPDVNWGDLEKLLVPYGKVLELTVYSERSYAFSRLDTHENAARAIIGLQGSIVKGKAIRTAWRDRTIRDKMVDQWVLPQASASQVQLRALASMGGHHGTCEDPSSMNPNAMPFSDPRTLPSQGSIAPMPYTPVAAPGQPIMYQPMPSIQLMASMPPMARMGYQSGMLYPQDYNMQYPHGHNIPYPQGRNTQNPPQAYDPGMYAMAQAYPNTMAAYGDDPANLEHSMSRMRV